MIFFYQISLQQLVFLFRPQLQDFEVVVDLAQLQTVKRRLLEQWLRIKANRIRPTATQFVCFFDCWFLFKIVNSGLYLQRGRQRKFFSLCFTGYQLSLTWSLRLLFLELGLFCLSLAVYQLRFLSGKICLRMAVVVLKSTDKRLAASVREDPWELLIQIRANFRFGHGRFALDYFYLRLKELGFGELWFGWRAGWGIVSLDFLVRFQSFLDLRKLFNLMYKVFSWGLRRLLLEQLHGSSLSDLISNLFLIRLKANLVAINCSLSSLGAWVCLGHHRKRSLRLRNGH